MRRGFPTSGSKPGVSPVKPVELSRWVGSNYGATRGTGAELVGAERSASLGREHLVKSVVFSRQNLAAGEHDEPNRCRPVHYRPGRYLAGVQSGFQPRYAKHRSEPPRQELEWKRQGRSNHHRHGQS